MRRRVNHEDTLSGSIQQVNWAGVITIILSFILYHYVLNQIIPAEFISAIIVSLLLYPLLRIYLLN